MALFASMTMSFSLSDSFNEYFCLWRVGLLTGGWLSYLQKPTSPCSPRLSSDCPSPFCPGLASPFLLSASDFLPDLPSEPLLSEPLPASLDSPFLLSLLPSLGSPFLASASLLCLAISLAILPVA